MKLTTGLLNYTGTPGAYTNTFANRPGATAVPTGTLYFSKDTNILYQTNGTSWISYSGGGGGSQNLASVLTIGNIATNTITLTTVGGQILEYSGDYIDNGIVQLYWGISQQEIGFKYNGGNLFGLAIDFRSSVRTTYMGDVQQSFNGTELWVNDNTRTIKTFDNRGINSQGTGLNINFTTKNYYLGDWFGYNDNTYIKIDDPNQETTINSPASTIIKSNTTTIQANTAGNGVFNFDDSAFISATAGGNSGQHLVIFVQGVQYKITLNNP